MATLSSDFGAASDPALALRIANLITQDIEKLERALFGTSSNWQRMEKPFKAHYAVALVNRMDTDKHALALEKLPEYERNAANYRNDSRRRGRPLTTYTHKTEDSTMPVQITQKRDVPAPQAEADNPLDALDSDVREAVEYEARNVAEALRAAMAQKQVTKAMQQAAQPKPDNESPVQRAARELAEALQAEQKQDDTPPMNEDRIREIAREEDAKLAERIKPVTTVRVEHVRADVTETRDMGLQHKQFPTLLKLCQLRNADGFQYPVWLPGPAGSGKTTAARNVAKALELPFLFTGAVDQPYSLLGFRDAGGNYARTSFREAFENGGVFLWDEVDASNPNALTVFNAALENGVCAFPDGNVVRHKDCIIIAAANTYGHGATHEYVGRNKLDAATVDRFIMLDWSYDEALERALAMDDEFTTYVQNVRKAVARAGIKHVVSPRASIRGGEMLAEGFDRDFVIASVVRKGLPDDSWRQVSAGR